MSDVTAKPSRGFRISTSEILLIAVVAALAVFAWAFLTVRRLVRDEGLARLNLLNEPLGHLLPEPVPVLSLGG